MGLWQIYQKLTMPKTIYIKELPMLFFAEVFRYLTTVDSRGVTDIWPDIEDFHGSVRNGQHFSENQVAWDRQFQIRANTKITNNGAGNP